MASLAYHIYQGYYANKVYIYCAALQIILCFLAIVLVFRNKPEELVYSKIAEYLVIGIMILDVLIFSFVDQFQTSIINILEWIFVLIFIFEIVFHGFYNKYSQTLRTVFTCFRIIFLFIRIFLGVSRMRTIYVVEDTGKTFDLNEDKGENEAKENPAI